MIIAKIIKDSRKHLQMQLLSLVTGVHSGFLTWEVANPSGTDADNHDFFLF